MKPEVPKTMSNEERIRRTTRRRISDSERTGSRRTDRRSLLPSLMLGLLVSLLIGPQEASSLVSGSSSGIQSLLLDTTEQSALGWTKYPDGGPQTRTPGWVEESFTNFERGINWRSFVVCDVAYNSVNNWLWTPFIERGEANRLYIEIKFTMRDCNLFPQMVLSCKETFALLYKEMDAPIQQQQSGAAANASFAQSDSYTLIDAIAADEGRFTSNTEMVINTEIRSIPVTKKGVYFAFRDQGACLSLISIKVYHTNCPQLSTNFAHFNQTPTGRDLTSLVAVEGSCVPNSQLIEQPRMFCASDGNWNSMSSGQCKCLAGFEPANNQTKCLACPPGRFKAALGDLACQSCPERSSAPYAGATECKCHDGFYRAPKDSRSAPCTQAPSAPTNLSAVYIDSSTVVLQWQAPKYTGNRDDLTYKLLCDNCEQTMVSSPQYYANFSETKCVLSGLSPSTSYRFVVYAMNGVSQQAPQAAQYSEISLQTARPTAQTTSNTLSAQGGFQLTPIYNFRALPGARGSDMILAWDAQPLSAADTPLLLGDGLDPQQLPSLYEVRFQARYAADQLARRSPYPLMMNGVSEAGQQQQQPQSVTTTNRALLVSALSPRTEYAFQIRTKWAHNNQWSEFSEPVYMTTSSQLGAAPSLEYPFDLSGQLLEAATRPGGFMPTQNQQQQLHPTGSSWLGGLVSVLVCGLFGLAMLSATLLYYRRSVCMDSLGASFGALGSSAYGGVYGHGPGAGLMSGLEPLGGFRGVGHHHHHHHTTQSSGSAGGLITGSNDTSRASSGGNVVQNFIAATLGQIGGGHGGHHQPKGGLGTGHGGKLYAATEGQPQQRNHYHQTLSGLSHTMLLNNHGHFQQQQQQPHTLAHLTNQSAGELFKYRTLGQQQQHQQQQQQQGMQHQQLQHPAHYGQQDPQLHIYDDLDNTTCSMPKQSPIEIAPQRITVQSVIGRGEFGDVCQATLKSLITGAQIPVAVKTLKAQASDKAKLDFLVEASIMSQFEHPNIIHLEGVVTKSEPAMIVTEFIDNGSLDSYLRENKNRFTCLQLISMLRGIANGMQYLAKLNYVHKDLAARNILVNGQNVCKIADFGLSSYQLAPSDGLAATVSPSGEYTNDSTSTNSSNTFSSHTTTSTPTTASTMAGGSNLNQFQNVADQIAQQRFAPQPPQPILPQQPVHNSIHNPKIPVRWTALEAIAFRRFTSASDVWSFGIVCWEVMTYGERPYWTWSNQDVIKALEQGYRLPQPDGCPEQLYKMMLDCWLKDRAARPTFGQILKTLDSLLNPYDDPFCQLPQMSCPPQQPQLVPMHTRISSQEPAYYDTYNPISQLITNNKQVSQKSEHQQSVEDWLGSIKMSRYLENFQRHQINTLQYVARLSQDDLNLIGIKNNQHLKKILNAIMSLRSTSSIGACAEGYLV